VDGITAITSRIAEIRGTIAGFSPPAAVPASSLGVSASAPATAGWASGATSTSGTFATALATEVAHGTAPSVPAVPAGTLTARGVPADLAAHGNGRIPREALSEIGSTGHRMWAPAARQYEALSAAAARDGVTIGITDSYRTFESQVDLAERKGLYKNGGLAAVPGTSDHGWGRSLDLRLDGAALAWMRENGAAFGFREDVPRESWHWTYYPPGT
jgi:D-alanyl-D-alanine carboxypeptidase